MSREELKSVILGLFDQIRELNARLSEKDRIAAEKGRMIASLSGKLDTVLDNQKQSQLDLKSWQTKEQQWLKERNDLLKANADLKDVVEVLKKAKFARTSQKGKHSTL